VTPFFGGPHFHIFVNKKTSTSWDFLFSWCRFEKINNELGENHQDLGKIELKKNWSPYFNFLLKSWQFTNFWGFNAFVGDNKSNLR
jgi:hypothetical protein